MRVPRLLAGLHAGYLLATGVWPIVHRRSFERVTGPKHDFWLVRVVGGLVAMTGVTLGVAAIRGRRSAETMAVVTGSAIVFGVADVWAGRNQSAIYYADLAPQAIFTTTWFVPWSERAAKS
jgi:hypothetical protein